MSIAARLSFLRKHKGLSQRALAEAIGLHTSQIKRYEAGTSHPSLEAIKKTAKTLCVTSDSSIFEEDELVANADLALQFHAIANMPDQQQSVTKQLLEAWSSSTRPSAGRPK